MALIKVCDVCGIKEDNCAKPMWKMVMENRAVKRHIDICDMCLEEIRVQSLSKRNDDNGDKVYGKKV